MDNTNCPHCSKPAIVTADGEIEEHVGGPADGSFICHYEPDELPAGQSYCDCWSCEESVIAAGLK